MQIVPAIIPRDPSEIEATIKNIECAGATVHVDATDGVYAGESCWIPEENERLPSVADTTYEVHLMVVDQEKAGQRFIHAGAMRIVGQFEAFSSTEEVQRALGKWKEGNAEVGLAVLLGTPLSALEPLKEHLNVIQVMSIPSIGAQGVALDDRVWQRLKDVQRQFPGITISVDGGVKESHIFELVQHGVDRAVVGSGILKAKSPAEMYARMVAQASTQHAY